MNERNFDTWGNLRGEPFQCIEEKQGDNYVKISIFQVGELFAYGLQLKVGTIIDQKIANINGTIYKSVGAAREAAGKEVEAICATNKNSKKYFAEFQKIRFVEYDLFGGWL